MNKTFANLIERNVNFNTVAKSALTIIVIVALAALAVLGAHYGVFGTSAQIFIDKVITLLFQSKAGIFPSWGLTTIGLTLTEVALFSVTYYIFSPTNYPPKASPSSVIKAGDSLEVKDTRSRQDLTPNIQGTTSEEDLTLIDGLKNLPSAAKEQKTLNQNPLSSLNYLGVIPTNKDNNSAPSRAMTEKSSVGPETNKNNSDASAGSSQENKIEGLPKGAFSKNGSLGNKHIESSLRKRGDSEVQINAAILKSFSQRKFPSTGNLVDKQGNYTNSAPLNESGHAISTCLKKPHEVLFMSDKDIIHRHECSSFEEDKETKIIVGSYEDKKCIIQQPGMSACVFTCAAMLLKDRGIDFPLVKLLSVSVSEDSELDALLKKHGYKLHNIGREPPKETKINSQRTSFIKKIQSNIKSYGSLFVNVYGESVDSYRGISGHKIILDQINEKEAVIRDPFHGWRITVSTEALLKQANAFHSMQQLTQAEKDADNIEAKNNIPDWMLAKPN